MSNTKSGFVSIIGRPNVGKSTLMNYIIGQKIAITSNKPQTTRNRIQTVYTTDDAQIVFLDTPGLHNAKNKLGEFMVHAAKSTFGEADVVLYLVEASKFIGNMDKDIIEILKTVSQPIILVINKVDLVKKEELFEIIETFSKQVEVSEVVPLSAKTGSNVDSLLECIKKYLPEGPFYYDPDTLTDQTEREIVGEIIREKALRLLNEEVPHGIAVDIESMEFKSKIVNIEATIYCERDSHKGIVIGKGGAMLKNIGTKARMDIEEMLEKKVNLKLWVKVRKDWRDNDRLVSNFGYKDKDDDWE